MVKLFNNNSNLEHLQSNHQQELKKNNPLVTEMSMKRTSKFLQKRLSTMSQPSSGQKQSQPQRRKQSLPIDININTNNCNNNNKNNNFYMTSNDDHYFTSTSFVNNNTINHNIFMAYQAFKKSYKQFLNIQELNQEWASTWKESLLDSQLSEGINLTSSQLKFQELVYEIILTEKLYVQDLTLAYQIFAKDALTWHCLPRSLRLIFDNLLQIIGLHLNFLKDLRYRQNDQHPIISSITDIFLNYIPRFLDYYSSYFINFEQANDIIAQSIGSDSNNTLGDYLKTRSRWSECRNLTLQSFLLKPVQRLMKYPLFFKSLSDTLSNEDPLRFEHLFTLKKLEATIRKIEQEKQENEDLRKLQDLVTRITGINESIIESGRHLIFEGYLSLVPSLQSPMIRSITTDSLGYQSYTYTPHPNIPRSHSNSFSLIPSKKSVYVFLFNDVIICTKVRSKTRVKDNYIKLRNYYGPNPNSLFKLILPPGQVTFVDRSVARPTNNSNSKDDMTPTRKLSSQLSFSRKFSSLRQSRSSHTSIHHQLMEYEEHPQQFICSIATQYITNFHFEANSKEEKENWCKLLKNALETHLQRKEWWNNTNRRSLPEINNNKSNNKNSDPFITSYQQTLELQTKKMTHLDIQQIHNNYNDNYAFKNKNRGSTMSSCSSSSSISSSNESKEYTNNNTDNLDEPYIPKFTSISPLNNPIIEENIKEIDNWIHPLDESNVLPSNPLNIHF